MNLANCPHCDEPVRIPESPLPDRAQAKCPWCMEFFAIEEISDKLPPMVQLFDDSGLPIETTLQGLAFNDGASAETVVEDERHLEDEPGDGDDQEDAMLDPEQSSSDASEETWTDNDEPTEHQFAPSDETVAFESDVESFPSEVIVEDPIDEAGQIEPLVTDDHPETSTEAPVGAHDFRIEESGPISDSGYEVVSDLNTDIESTELNSGLAPMRVKTNSRKRPKRSGLRTLLGIALGPIFALPIAGVIFYLLGTDLGFWPLDGGRSSGPSMDVAPPMDLSHFDPRPADDPASTISQDDQTADSTSPATEVIPALESVAANNQSLASSKIPDLVDETSSTDEDVELDKSFWVPPELSDELAKDAVGESPMTIEDIPWGDDDAALGPSEPAAADSDPRSALTPNDSLAAEEAPADASTTASRPPEMEEVDLSDISLLDAERSTVSPDSDIIVLGEPENAPAASPLDALMEPDDAAESTLPSDSLATESPTTKLPKEEKNAVPEMEPTSPEPSQTPVPPVDPEFVALVADATNQLTRLDGLTETSKKYKLRLAETYAIISKVGDEHAGDQNDDVEALFSQLKASPHFNAFSASTQQWIDYTKRTSEGVLLIGRPGSNENGPTITLPSGTVVSMHEDSVVIPKRGRVVAVGRIESQTPDVVVRVVFAEKAN